MLDAEEVIRRVLFTKEPVSEEDVLRAIDQQPRVCENEDFIFRVMNTPKINEKIVKCLKSKYKKPHHQLERSTGTFLRKRLIDDYENQYEDTIKGYLTIPNVKSDEMITTIITHGDLDKYYSTLVGPPLNMKDERIAQLIRYVIEDSKINDSIKESVITKYSKFVPDAITLLNNSTKIKNAFSHLSPQQKIDFLDSIRKKDLGKKKSLLLPAILMAVKDSNKEVSDTAKKVIGFFKS